MELQRIHFFNNFILLLGLVPLVATYKVLLLSTPYQSHLTYFAHIGEGLSEAGHSPYMVMSCADQNAQQIEQQGICILYYNSHNGICKVGSDEFLGNVSDAVLESGAGAYALEQALAPAVAEECDKFLTDDRIFQKAKEMEFDLAVVDDWSISRCLYLFPGRLMIPYITVSVSEDVWNARTPSLPSFVPFHYSTLSDSMTFWERTRNIGSNLVWGMSSQKSPLSSQILKKFSKRPKLLSNYENLITKSKLWLVNSDIVLDYPKPSMPNVVNIGGLTAKPSKSLSVDLERFMNEAPEGVIVVSFGSVLVDLPDAVTQKLISAFEALNYSIIWKMKQLVNVTLPDNVRTLPWIPQNDLLGHPKTVAFVSNCGSDGQFEAMYHGVPIVGIPVMEEQHYNCKRMQVKGYGTCLDFNSFTPEDLTHSLSHVTNDSNFYKNNLLQASQIFVDRLDTPAERAVYWIEHIIKYGGSHLRSSALDLAWYKYLMLDVFFFFDSLSVLVVGLIAFCVKWGLHRSKPPTAAVPRPVNNMRIIQNNNNYIKLKNS